MDVAERFAAQHEPPLEIVITGLRPNEKLHEDLISTDELGERRVHKLITHVDGAAAGADHRDVAARCRCPTEIEAIALSGSADLIDGSDRPSVARPARLRLRDRARVSRIYPQRSRRRPAGARVPAASIRRAVDRPGRARTSTRSRPRFAR